MSWMQALARTYDLVPVERIGKKESDADGAPDEDGAVLLPICHTTNQVQIEVRLSSSGDFLGASVIDPKQATTIIPCTEESGGKTGIRPTNHPLADKLQYLAGDFCDFGGEVTSGFLSDPLEPYRNYISDLETWCASGHSHPKARVVLAYSQKGRLIRDLAKAKILHLGKDGKLLHTWPGETGDEPPIFKLMKGQSTQQNAFVRWKVAIPGILDDTTWRDSSLWKSWADYYASTRSQSGFCYASGRIMTLAEQHPAKIRNSGDKAKLVSSNDSSGFTFRGRFIDADQACVVGFETTQKAHNALRWLFARQGDWKSGLVTWALSPESMAVIPPTTGTDEFSEYLPEFADSGMYDPAQHAAIQFRNKVRGYFGKIDLHELVVMGLDAATPGRMSMTYYRELKGSDYLDRLGLWHGERESEGLVGCVWHLDYGFDKVAKRRRLFFGAPSPKDMALACYGSRVDEKLLRDTVGRILPCIIDGEMMPTDIMRSAVERVKRRSGADSWEWNKNLGIACALFRKHSADHMKGRYEVSLEEDRTTRDYLYGRLLAVAERIERFYQQKLRESGRETRAEYYMQRFAERPYATWKTIELLLRPYIQRLGSSIEPYRQLMDQIADSFERKDFISDRPLEGEFLLGYHSQRIWLDRHHFRQGQWELRMKESASGDDDETSDSED